MIKLSLIRMIVSPCTYFIIILFIMLIMTPINAQSVDGTVNITISYDGGDVLCDASQCAEDDYFPNYYCSNSSLINYFQDPVPKGYFVNSMSVTMFGMFGCEIVPTIGVFVDKTRVGFTNTQNSPGIPVSTSNCTCNNCAVSFTLESALQVNGWPNYVYHGNNTINVIVSGDYDICLSQAILSITYQLSQPVLVSVIPDSSPINSETPVKIIGSNFINSSNLTCNFGDYTVPALYVDYLIINCTTPSIDTPQVMNLTISDSGTQILAAGEFTFYEQPIIDSFSPTSGNAQGGENVYLIGSNFFNNTQIACRFGKNLATDASYINGTCVVCINPKNSQLQSTTSVSVYFSENRVQYIEAPYNFTFIVPITPTPTVSVSSSYIVSLPSSSQSPSAPSPTISTTTSSVTSDDQPLPDYIWAAFGVLLLIIIVLLIGCLIGAVRNLRKKKMELSEQNYFVPTSDHSSAGSFISNSSAGSNDLSDMDPNAIPVHEIKNLRQIEKGSFGVIYEATWRGTIIAVKKLPSNMNQKLLKEFYQEAALMRSLRHPNILQYLGVANSGGEISICMEFMARGSLYRLLHTNSDYSRSKIKSICLDTAKGMNYLHQHRPPIIHRDLKSHNLLVDEHWRVKVCDFGLSRIIVQANATMTACGTPSWTAPEVLRNERYTTKADVYGFGVVVWEMFARADPFPGMPPFQIVFAVGNQGLRPIINPNWHSDWVKLITDCWTEDPQLRPTFEQIIVRLEALNSPSDE